MTAIFTGLGAGFERGSGSVLGSAGLLGSAVQGRSGEQVFLNAATGNFMVSQRDEFLVGLGLDAAVSRTYNSLGDLSDDNGDNWRQGYDRRIVNLTGTPNAAGSTVQRVSGDGSVITYNWDVAKNAYVATDGGGAYDALTFANNEWTWTDGDSRTTETYAANGNYWLITRQTDTDGNSLTMSYLADGRLYRATTQDGAYVQYNWSGNNITEIVTGYTDDFTNPSSPTFKTLTRTRYTYDAQNRLSKVTVDLSPQDNNVDTNANGITDAGEGYVTTYTYDGSSTRIARIVQSDGSQIDITYTADGTYRVASLIQTASTGVTRTTSVTYNVAESYTLITDPLGQVVRLDYDSINGDAVDGSLKKITLPPAVAGGAQQQIEFDYDGNGDVEWVEKRVTGALDQRTTYSSFVNGLWTTKTDRVGNVVTRTYGSKNELLTETTISSDAGSSAAAHTVRFVYDSENHLRYRVSAEGHVTEYRYTATGLNSSVIEHPEQYYDVSALAPTSTLSENQLNAWRDAIIDKTPNKNVVYTYDARGNLTSAERTTTAGTSADGFTKTHFTYDQAGNLKSRNNPGGNIETFVYDGLNRLASVVDVNGMSTTFVFNDAATTTTVTTTFVDGRELRQISTYNKAGELISFAEQAVDPTNLGEVVGTATYSYDKNGRLRLQVDATGRKTYFLYDQLGRKVANVSSQGDVIEYRYDSDNRLIATIAHGARYVGSLTALDNPDAVINPATYIPASNTSDLWSWIVYDKEGRVLQMIAGDGSTSVNAYDGVGRLVSTASYYNRLTNAQLTTIKATLPTAVTLSTLGPDSAKDRVARNFYDKDGRLLGVLDGEGFLTRIIYDKAGQKVRETRFFNATSAALRATGTFNQLVASITPSSTYDRTINYTYNGQGQLKYAIDSLGYVTQTDYDSAGQATTVIQYAATLPTTTDYTYDNVNTLVASGNLAASVGTRRSWTVYDGAGRAAYVIDAEGAVVANSYNAAGELIKTTQFNTIRSTPSLPSKATMDSWAQANASASDNRVTRFYYDGVGELRYTVDAEGYVTRVDLDAEGRVTDSRRWANKVSVSDSTTIDNLHSSITASGGAESRTITAYDPLGRIEKITDGEGFITFREYGANGLVWRETHAWGTTDTRVSTFYYDGAGRITHTRDAEDYVTEASYNPFGEVNKLTRRYNKATGTAVSGTAPTVAADAIRDATTYTYYDRRGLAVSARDAEDYVIETTYDAFGQVTSFTHRYNKATGAPTVEALPTVTANAAKDATSYNYYDKRGQLTVSRDSENYLAVTTYTAFGQVDTVTRRYNRTTSPVSLITVPTATAHANDATTDIDYDRLGRVIKVTDAESQIEQYTLNAFGDIVKLVDKLGNSTFSYFDKRGLRVATRDAEDYVTHTSYNALGQVDTVTRRYNKATGTAVIGILPTVAANSTKDAVTSRNYDKRGLLIEVRDAEDYVTRTSYTAHGQADKVTRFYNKATGTRVSGTLATVAVNAKDAVTDIDYDRLGRVTKSTDAELKFERFEYDAFGNRTKWFNKINAEFNYGYDKRGLLTSETLPMVAMRADGTTQATSVINRFEYDARGNRTKMIEASGLTEQRTTLYDYDRLDRLVSKSLDAVSALNQSDHRTTSTVTPTESYVYDAAGNLKQVTDALGGRTVSFYDRIGRKTDEVGPLGTMTHWTFDAAGNMLTARIYGDVVAVPAATATTPPSPPTNFRETGYTYDKLGRLKTTSVANVLVGVWNGSGVAPTPQLVTTSQDYDAFNNVIKTVDANLYATFSYYDRLGRKTTQSDALNFVTKWVYDAEGNVTKETRYANALGSAPAITTEPAAPTTSADDRITNFTYDKNGRRLTEARTGVIAYSVNATNGQLTLLSSTQTVTYTYNALGQVATKQEATGDTVTYSYDGTGRLLTETRAAIVDYTGATVSPMVQYAYNALNDLAFTRQGKSFQAAGDRFTRYTYGAGGRLASMTDAAGGIHNYAYDAAGNSLRDSYTRVKSDGSSANEGILYTRDLLGRITAQAIATDNGTSWVRGDSQNSEYNAYGDVARRGINGLWQESFAYDKMGRVSATNSGDGVWRFFVYDANGNQTLAIESEGSDLDNLTVDQALALARPGGVAAGSAFVDGINVAITVYDKRNMAIESHLRQRELAIGGALTEILTKQTYNAFGEVSTQTDAVANLTYGASVPVSAVTQFKYNTMGRLMQKVLPAVSVTSETGAVSTVNPTENYFYDTAGRLVATQDANGNIISRTLLAGTGYGGTEALVTHEYHADGGIAQTFYNHFGDARILRNELNQDEWRDYDAMGRLAYQSHRTGLIENYAYDLLGQRIARWNSFYGSTVIETTDYDLQGRVVSTKDYAGDRTNHTYAWDATITTALGTSGGWTQTTTQWAQLGSTLWKQKSQTTSLHGLTTREVDFAGNTTDYTYDKAGRLTQKVGTIYVPGTTEPPPPPPEEPPPSEPPPSEPPPPEEPLPRDPPWRPGDPQPQSEPLSESSTLTVSESSTTSGTPSVVTTLSFSHFNTGLTATVADSTWGMTANAINSTFAYDAMGRRTRETYSGTVYRSYSDSSYTTLTAMYGYVLQDAAIAYDALGRLASFTNKNASGVTDLTMTQVYDAAGNIRRTQTTYPNLVSSGSAYSDKWFTYDAMNRMVVADGALVGGTVTDYNVGGAQFLTYDVAGNRKTASNTRTESYYDGEGYYEEYDVTTTDSYNYDADNQLTTVYKDGALKANTTRDIRGRVTEYREYAYGAPGGVANHRYNIVYNARGQVSSENTFQWNNGGADIPSAITNTYDNYGNLTYQRSVNTNGLKDTWQSWTMAWWDAPVVQSSTFDRDYYGSNSNYSSTQTYDGLGRLQRSLIADGKARAVHFGLNSDGQVVSRWQSNNSSNDPAEMHRFVAGNQIAEYTNDAREDLRNYDYQALILTKTSNASGSGRFYQGTTTGTVGGEFGTSGFDPTNAITAGTGQASRSRYTVQAGDTLQSIARQMWGDGSLWYKIAEANGLSGDASLAAGQALSLPLAGPASRNNADMFRPYDASSAVGDLNPTSSKPPKKKSGGLFGKILLAVIQVVLTIVLTTVFAPLGPLAPVAAATVANIVTQGVGVATGIQDKFSWKQVAMTAITASFAPPGTGGILGNAAMAAATNAAVQGIGVATGLQKKFDWVGVAAAGVSAGVGTGVGGIKGFGNLSPAMQTAIGGSARLISNAATRSVLNGESFGDNVIAGLPDVIAQTVGGVLQERIAAAKASAHQERINRILGSGSLSEDQLSDPRFKKYVEMELSRGKSPEQISGQLADPNQLSRINAMEYRKIPGTDAYALAIPVGDPSFAINETDGAVSREYALSGKAEVFKDPDTGRLYRLNVGREDFQSFEESKYSKFIIDRLNKMIASQTGEKIWFYDGYLIQGGTQSERDNTARALAKIADTPRGKVLLGGSLKTSAQERIIVDSRYNDTARAFVDYGTIVYNPKLAADLALFTTAGWVKGPAQIPAIIAHEMGHIYNRITDAHYGKNWATPGGWHMKNVILNENPVRKALGVPERLTYDWYSIKEIGPKPGVYQQDWNGSYWSEKYLSPLPKVKVIN